MYDEALKNTRDDDNVQFGCGYKKVNKFMQLKKQSMLSEPSRTISILRNSMSSRCTSLFRLLILNHIDVIFKQGVS